jgi:transcription elongation GreA/GreB family factor
MPLKERLFAHCEQYVFDRIKRIQDEIRNAQASANEETKSSAGDKYETGRAMAQLAVERSTQQLAEAEKLLWMLRGLPTAKVSDRVIPGSLVTTSNGVFYVAISLGLVTLEEISCFVVSPDSPIGKLLLGKRLGEAFTWNGNKHIIRTIE